MKNSTKLATVLMLCSWGAQAGVVTPVTTRAGLGANDLLTWGTAAQDGNSVTSPYSVNSTGGVAASAVLTGGFNIYVQNGSAFVGNFSPGDIILDTAFNDGPVTINFGSAVRGVGFQIQHLNFGSFTGTLNFYGAGNTLFGTVTANGTSSTANDGSAVFLGGTSDLRDIVSVVVSVNQVGGSSAFDINQMSLLTTDPGGAVPEPSTYLLASLGLAGGFWVRRHRRS